MNNDIFRKNPDFSGNTGNFSAWTGRTSGLTIPLSVTDTLTTRLAGKEDIATLRKASQAVTHEQCRTLLAYTALESAMLLSALQAQAYRMAPFGEERYQWIVDAFATGAANQIARW